MKVVMGKGTSSPKIARMKWTVHEMLCLVEAKKESLEDGATGVEWLMQGATHRAPFAKWQVVAAICSSKCGAKKSHTQCFLKWRRLLKPWRAIFLAGPHRYWLMSREERRAAGLPLCFNRKIFNAILNAFNASDNVTQPPQLQELRARRTEIKSSMIDLEDVEELPSVKIEDDEECELLHREAEVGGSWDAWGLMPSFPIDQEDGQDEANQQKRSHPDDKRRKLQEKKTIHDARIAHDVSGEENLQSRVAETSQAWVHGQHTNLHSQENHVEENRIGENTHMEDNDMQDCSTNLRLDKETIGKFLESINSMAKVMETIVRALTR